MFVHGLGLGLKEGHFSCLLVLGLEAPVFDLGLESCMSPWS